MNRPNCTSRCTKKQTTPDHIQVPPLYFGEGQHSLAAALTRPCVQFFQVWLWGSRAAWRTWAWTLSWADGTSTPSWPWRAARWAAGKATWPTCAEDRPSLFHSIEVTVSSCPFVEKQSWIEILMLKKTKTNTDDCITSSYPLVLYVFLLFCNCFWYPWDLF